MSVTDRKPGLANFSMMAFFVFSLPSVANGLHTISITPRHTHRSTYIQQIRFSFHFIYGFTIIALKP